MILISISDEEGQEDIPAHQVLGTMYLGLPPQAKRLPTLAKVPYRLPCRQITVKEALPCA
jgi:hypothetical protein